MIQACIFDLDGVIVDTAKYHFVAWKSLAEELNIPFNEVDNERLKGVSRMQSLEILLGIGRKTFSQQKKHMLAQRKNVIYVTHINRMKPDEVFPGVREFIKKLKRNKIKVALGSASKNTPLILKRIKMEGLFDVVVDGNSVRNAKPDPEIFLTCAMKMNVWPSATIVFEDSIAGIQAAKSAGMYKVGVGDKNVLSEADIIIPGFSGLTIEKLQSGLEMK